ncbi:MAG: hypothetical protein HWQ38_00070 [Nostoc sp. NMS7]|uniref:hypothetical protein n=1 Tax=Nostoc sp. NMS7 TaxID=2815391 RepID=UPI0025E98F96|nr:hypothetical protein [Nostoc sp. NMS7]MBN3944961.1 hypothetical protein [Nostoc sp. NMS7]
MPSAGAAIAPNSQRGYQLLGVSVVWWVRITTALPNDGGVTASPTSPVCCGGDRYGSCGVVWWLGCGDVDGLNWQPLSFIRLKLRLIPWLW